MDARSPNKCAPAKEEPVRKLLLFVAEGEAHSLAARTNVQKLLNTCGNVPQVLQIVNVLEDYQAALTYRVLVSPCLIQVEPPPRIMIVGTLEDVDQVRTALGLNAEEGEDV
ncbi:MAG: circadian clock KaiB family protein [Candidatus Binatia bacterium]